MNFVYIDIKDRDPNNKALVRQVDQYNALLMELKKRNLPDQMVKTINAEVREINQMPGSIKESIRSLKKVQSRLLKELESAMSIVTKGHYRNIWLAKGTGIFGVPIGIAFAFAIDNMAMLGVGLPVGSAVGIAVGSNYDKKAWEQGRQLDIEIKY